MNVFILEKVPVSLRGELTRWLVEPFPGVFVGRVSGMVRDRLWEKCCKNRRVGGVVHIWSTNTEQRFRIRMCGDTRRAIVDLDGIQLITIPANKTSSSDRSS